MRKKQEALKEYKMRNTYLEVLKNFPNMREGETELRFNKKTDFIQISLTYNEKINDGTPFKIPTMNFGPYFLTLSEEEQKASIAHELGHFNYWIKNCNHNTIMRKFKWGDDTEFYDEHRWITYIISFLSGKSKRRIERLQKMYTMIEIRADNEAARAGYAKPFLSVLKKISSNYGKQPQTYQKEIKARINNLERMLGS